MGACCWIYHVKHLVFTRMRRGRLRGYPRTGSLLGVPIPCGSAPPKNHRRNSARQREKEEKGWVSWRCDEGDGGDGGDGEPRFQFLSRLTWPRQVDNWVPEESGFFTDKPKEVVYDTSKPPKGPSLTSPF